MLHRVAVDAAGPAAHVGLCLMQNRNLPLFLAAAFLVLAVSTTHAKLEPTDRDVAYGKAKSQKLDIYLPEGDGPFPFVMNIHGGGWHSGDKKWKNDKEIKRFTDKGVAYVTINYRLLGEAGKDGLFPPVLGPLQDSARALQFLRANAKKYRLDPERVGVTGGSAGGFNALWLGTAPDQADPVASDPVERESTRVTAVAVKGAQTSLDPQQMIDWVGPELKYGAHAFGMAEGNMKLFLERREQYMDDIRKVSPAELVSPDDPPIFLYYSRTPGDAKKDHMYYVHSPAFGQGFQKLATEKGATVYLMFKGGKADGYDGDMTDFLIEKVTAK